MITKDELIKTIMSSSEPVAFDYESLKFAFGYKRIDGMQYSMMKAFNTSLTEEQVSFCSPHQMINNIEEWCRSNSILFHHDSNNRRFVFKKM